MRVEDGIVHVDHVDVEVGRDWLQQSHISGSSKSGKPHLVLFGRIWLETNNCKERRKNDPSVKSNCRGWVDNPEETIATKWLLLYISQHP